MKEEKKEREARRRGRRTSLRVFSKKIFIFDKSLKFKGKINMLSSSVLGASWRLRE